MPDSDELRVNIAEAESLLRNAVSKIRGTETEALDKVGQAINVARLELQNAVKSVLDVTQDIDDARSRANAVLVGTSGLVAESIVMMTDAQLDQEDMIKKLYVTKDYLDRIMSGILPVAVVDKDNDAAKLTAAEAHLRGYRSTIP